MKGIYYADPTTHVFTRSDIVADDYQLQVNETFENPTGKLEPAKLVGTSWQDATEEEHATWVKQQEADFKRLHPDTTPAEPSEGDQALNLLGQQIAKMQQQQMTMSQSINALGQLVAKAQGTTTASQAQDAPVASQAQSEASASQAQGTTTDTKTQA